MYTTKSTYAVPGAQVIRDASGVYYVLGDHLGSASVTLNAAGGLVGELRYYAYGATRLSTGTTPTDRRYTGQREQADIGLYYYNARWYDPALARFTSADTIVPGAGNPQTLNRYAYVLNNPLKHIDPSGHDVMIVGGFTSNLWTNPEEFAEWIMTYKGWDQATWDRFLWSWNNGSDSDKSDLMASTVSISSNTIV